MAVVASMSPVAEDADHLRVAVAKCHPFLERDPELGPSVGESVAIRVTEDLEGAMPAPGGPQLRALGSQPKASGDDPAHPESLLAEELEANGAVPQVGDRHVVGSERRRDARVRGGRR